MTSIIIAALAGWLALGFFIRWQRAEATIARLSPLAEIGERVGNQARDELGRFKAKGK